MYLVEERVFLVNVTIGMTTEINEETMLLLSSNNSIRANAYIHTY